MSDRSHLSIGEVLSLLREEFPDVTISKIRFLESQGLVDPERTPSGYRKFYDHDIERLRWILRQQRENFLPLKVIRGRLAQSGGPEGGAPPAEAPPEAARTGSGTNGRAVDVPTDRAVADPAAPAGGEPGAGRHPTRGGDTPAYSHPEAGSLSATSQPSGPAGPRTTDPAGGLPAGGPAPALAGPGAIAPDAPPSGAVAPPTPAGASGRSWVGGAADRRRADPPPARQEAAGGDSAAAPPAPTAGRHPAGAGSAPASGPPAVPDPAAPGPPAAPASAGGRGRTSPSGSGHEEARGAPPAARAPAPPPGAAGGDDTLTLDELAAASGLPAGGVADLQEYGLITASKVGGVWYYDREALAVARAAAGFARHGVEARHLRAWRNAADRQASLFEQVVVPLLKQRNPEARRQAAATLEELTTAGSELHAALLRKALRAIR